MDEPLVLAENISRCFGRALAATEVLHDTSCAIYAGDRIALTGPSGSGKSTLLHLLGGLDTPTSGRLSWPGIGSRAELRPCRVIDIFQGPSLLPPLSVLENVKFPLALRGVPEDEAMQRAHDALACFGLDHLGDKLPEEISGGQAQRVAIARAVAARPALVLADEPTGQLDSDTASYVLERLLEALAAIGAALIVATHDPRVTERLDIVWSMRDGTLSGDSLLHPVVHQPDHALAGMR